MPSYRTAVAVALLLTSVAQGNAQDVRARGAVASPEVTACALFGHLEGDRWDAAAGLFDERILESWQVAAARRYAEWTDFRVPSIEEYLEHNPGMPREVAAWQIDRARERSDGRIARQRIAVDSIEELVALSPREAAARALRAYDPVYQRDLALREPVFPGSAESRILAARVREETRRIVGVLVRGDRALVAYRTFAGSFSSDPRHGPPAILSLVRTAGGWRARPSGEDGGLLDEAYGFATVSAFAEEAYPEAAADAPAADGGVPVRFASAPGAEEVARRFLEHVERAEWEAAVDDFDPGALEEWRAREVEDMSRPAEVPTVAKILEQYPDKPRAVAEWEVEQQKRAGGVEAWIAHRFAGVETLEALRALAPREAAIRALEARVGRDRRPERDVAAAGAVEREIEIVGSIVEGVYASVLYQVRWAGDRAGRRVEITPIRPRILSLRRSDFGWAVVSRVPSLVPDR